MVLRDYLNKNYVQSLLIGFVTTFVYTLLEKNRTSEEQVSTSMKIVVLLKVFLASSIASIAVLYCVRFNKQTEGGGGGNVSVQAPALEQSILTGKPNF